MKFSIPRIVKPLKLAEYAEEFGDVAILMWVNPGIEMRTRYDRIQAEITAVLGKLRLETDPSTPFDTLRQAHGSAQGSNDDESEDAFIPDEELVEKIQAELGEKTEEIYAWWAEMWSQHKEPEQHWTVDDVRELAEQCAQIDPGLWTFIEDGCLDLMINHLIGARKK